MNTTEELSRKQHGKGNMKYKTIKEEDKPMGCKLKEGAAVITFILSASAMDNHNPIIPGTIALIAAGYMLYLSKN